MTITKMAYTIALIFVTTTPVTAQEISTDRPNLTNSTDTIPRGALQLETGLLISRQDYPSGRSHYIGGPFPLLRVGLASIAELRVGTNGISNESDFGAAGVEHHCGLSDVEIGVKIRVHDEHKYDPAIAIIPAISIPTGLTHFTSGRIDPSFTVAAGKNLPYGFNVSANFYMKRLIASSRNETIASISPARRIGRDYSAFAELYRLSPIEGDEKLHWIADAGITKLLRSNIQIDTVFGHTIQAKTPYWFTSMGFSIRFNNSLLTRLLARR